METLKNQGVKYFYIDKLSNFQYVKQNQKKKNITGSLKKYTAMRCSFKNSKLTVNPIDLPKLCSCNEKLHIHYACNYIFIRSS